MGYRSNIIIVLSKQAMAYTTIKGNLPAAFADADKHATHEDGYYWRFEGWKWYTGYPMVDEIANFCAHFCHFDEIDFVASNKRSANEHIELLHSRHMLRSIHQHFPCCWNDLPLCN